MKKEKTRITEKQLKEMKGRTNWARLAAEEKSSNKKNQPRQKTGSLF